MSYWIFLLVFIIAPTALLLLLGLLKYRRTQQSSFSHLRHWCGVGVLAIIAILWTSPWDNYIVDLGVWTYGEDRVYGIIGVVPLEEYAFMLLMPFFNGAVIWVMLDRAKIDVSSWHQPQTRARIIMVAVSIVLFLLGSWMFTEESGTYMGALLVWFVPPLAIQLIFDPLFLSHHWKGIMAATAIPTLYLSLADAYAIQDGIWTIHEKTRTGIEVFHLPIEEILFFFMISLLLAQGIYLWHGVTGKRTYR